MKHEGLQQLFVYGSLRKGESADLTEKRVGPTHYMGPATLSGYALFDLGSYPGIFPRDPSSRVKGETHWLEQPGPAFAWLDEYEDVPNLFQRLEVDVSKSSSTERAWTYVLTQDPDGQYPIVPNGSWPEHRRDRANR